MYSCKFMPSIMKEDSNFPVGEIVKTSCTKHNILPRPEAPCVTN